MGRIAQLGALLICCVAMAAPAAPFDEATDTGRSDEGGLDAETVARQAILERYAGAVVRVEAILKTKFNMGGQGEEQDSRIDMMGAVVDEAGLIMAWNSHISSSRLSEMMLQRGRGSSFEVEITPVEFEVYLEGEAQGVSAFLAATDSNLDLAFLHLEEAPDAPLQHVDFAASVAPRVGQQVVALSRLGRSFDYAPFLQTARIGGVLEKPREAWIVDGALSSYGLPVFTLDGRPVGALTTVLSRVSQEAQGNVGLGRMVSSYLGPGAGTSPLGTFILPGDRVRTLVGLARERADELLAERLGGEHH